MHFPYQHNLFEPWQQYQHPAVRQLAFAIASPNILSCLPENLDITHSFMLHDTKFWLQHYQNYRFRLQQLDQCPTPLLNFLQQLKSTRLGLRFEMFIWFWLLENEYHPYQLLGHSIQKIAGPKTLGELDFLLLNTETQKVEHWEVALKYYLAEADFNLQYWYGLNRSDTLYRKLNHFTQKQFQFTDALEHRIEQRYAVFKGQLYVPLRINYLLPHWVNTTRRLGQWGDKIPHADLQFYRLQRHEWICADAQTMNHTPIWWTDGLYRSAQNDYYMFRSPPFLSQSNL